MLIMANYQCHISINLLSFGASSLRELALCLIEVVDMVDMIDKIDKIDKIDIVNKIDMFAMLDKVDILIYLFLPRGFAKQIPSLLLELADLLD